MDRFRYPEFAVGRHLVHMIDDGMKAWDLFLHTGKISDYMRYRQTLCAKPEDDYIEDGDEPDANHNTGAGHWYQGY